MAKKPAIKNLVIVESPHKAKTIGKILGKEFVVMASQGHVADIAAGKGKGFIVEGVSDDFDIKYDPIPRKEAILKDLSKAVSKADNVFLCSDEDREGEAISWNLFGLLGLKKSSTRRVTFNEITPKAITEAFKHPRDIDMNLVNSQQARRILDRVVGYKLSPLLWDKIKRGLSAGRVQSVTVKLLAEREKEIAAFKSDEYWTVAGSIGTSFGGGTAAKPFPASLRLLGGSGPGLPVVSSAADVEKAKAGPGMNWMKDKATADTAVESVKGAGKPRKYVVSACDTKEVSKSPPPPFHTSSLQQAAANRLGYDVKRTMMVAQGLYEGVDVGSGPIGLITYMRTDSFAVSKDAQADCKKLVEASFGPSFYPAKPNYYKSRAGAQEAHECVRPTDVSLTPDKIRSKLSPEQAKLYELIWKRFVASQMAPAMYDGTTLDVSTSDGKVPFALFRATGRVVKFAGWTRAYEVEEDDEKDAAVPTIPVGQPAELVDWPTPVAAEQHFTQPPARYNDASLVKMMEKEGIGRPSTYASILTVIVERKYAEKMGHGGKAPLRATDIGMVVTDCLNGCFPSVMDVGFTRDMESKLDEVEEGKVGYKDVLKGFYDGFEKEMDAAKTTMKSTKGGTETEHPCPKCSKRMFRKLGTYGFFLACPDEDGCAHTMDVDADGKPKEKAPLVPTGIKCGKCGKDVVKATGRFGPYLCCSDYLAKPRVCDFTLKLSKAGLPLGKVAPIATGIECEKCKKHKMLIRATRSGKPFLSCPGFPRCRNADDVPASLKAEADEVHKRWLEKTAKDKVYAEAFAKD
jgi:DNA topoisomerase-1